MQLPVSTGVALWCCHRKMQYTVQEHATGVNGPPELSNVNNTENHFSSDDPVPFLPTINVMDQLKATNSLSLEVTPLCLHLVRHF